MVKGIRKNFHNIREFGDNKNVVGEDAVDVGEGAKGGKEAGGPIYIASEGHLVNVGDL